jgi:hypothetical protein
MNSDRQPLGRANQAKISSKNEIIDFHDRSSVRWL